MIFIISLFCNIFLFSNNACDILSAARNDFKKINSNQEAEWFIKTYPTKQCLYVTPYIGAVYMKQAAFYWNPYDKLKSFNKGKQIIENYLKQYPNDLEGRYIRWMCQKKAPSFLNYQQNLKTDYLYIISNISNSNIDTSYQKEILSNLKNYD